MDAEELLKRIRAKQDDLIELSFSDLDDENIVELGSRASLDRSPKSNWVEESGRLPGYVREIANSLHTKRGMTISRAIATAISRIKKWSRGGDGVNPDTVAKAQKALAQWEALKAKNKARKAVK